MSPPTPPKPIPPSAEHFDERFDELRGLISAATKKAGEAHDQAVSVRSELGKKLDDLAGTVGKLASARLLQQGFTSLILAGLIVVGMKALGA